MDAISRYTSAYVEERKGRFVVTMVDHDGKWWNCGHKHRGVLSAAACESKIKRQIVRATPVEPFAHDRSGALIGVTDTSGTVHILPRS